MPHYSLLLNDNWPVNRPIQQPYLHIERPAYSTAKHCLVAIYRAPQQWRRITPGPGGTYRGLRRADGSLSSGRPACPEGRDRAAGGAAPGRRRRGRSGTGPHSGRPRMPGWGRSLSGGGRRRRPAGPASRAPPAAGWPAADGTRPPSLQVVSGQCGGGRGELALGRRKWWLV